MGFRRSINFRYHAVYYLYIEKQFQKILLLDMLRAALITLLFVLSNSKQIRYDQDIANRMVNISAATYYINQQQADVNTCPRCYPGFKIAKVIYQIQQLAIIGYQPTLNSVVVAFRGSKEPTNFLQDAFAVPTPYSLCLFCFVHAGFAHALDLLYLHNLKQEILSEMEKHPGCGIIFTGHSLGGALANLAATNFQEQFGKKYPNIQIYTLGQPRVGGKLFANYQDKYLPWNFRIVHESDPIPHLPTKKMLYRHSGLQIWYSQDMKSIKNRCSDDSDDCSNSANHLPVTVKLFDHDYRKYTKLSNKLGLKDLQNQEL